MDIVATALTAAWLDAVRRTRSEIPPIPQTGPAETLTDVIESALRHGGLDSLDPTWVDPTRPGQLIDLRV